MHVYLEILFYGIQLLLLGCCREKRRGVASLDAEDGHRRLHLRGGQRGRRRGKAADQLPERWRVVVKRGGRGLQGTRRRRMGTLHPKTKFCAGLPGGHFRQMRRPPRQPRKVDSPNSRRPTCSYLVNWRGEAPLCAATGFLKQKIANL